jgi:hypothetical protein
VILVGSGEAIIYQYCDKVRRVSFTKGRAYQAISLKLRELKAQRLRTRKTGRFIKEQHDFRQVIREGSAGFNFLHHIITSLTASPLVRSAGTMADDTQYAIINMISELVYDLLP